MKYVLIAGAVILAVFLFFLLQIPLGIEPLTELYFENHTELPAYLFLNKTYNFSFTVHNLEYMDMNYSYDVILQYNNKTLLADSGNFVLANNETKTTNKTLIFKEHFDKAKISIRLDKLTENEMQKDPNLKNVSLFIHFWVEEIKGPTITIVPD
jgi:hypothetical protein